MPTLFDWAALFKSMSIRKPHGYYRRVPHFRDLSDYHLSPKLARNPYWRNPPMIKDDPIDQGNFFATFGRYRSKTRNSRPDFYGLDANGRKLGANSLLGKFVTFKNGKPFTTVNQFVGGTLVRSDDIIQTWDQINPGPPYKVGGPFFTADSRYANSGTIGPIAASDMGKPGITSDNKTVYTGMLLDSGVWGTDSINNYRVSKPLPRVLTAYHSLAFDRLKPQVAKVNVGQFLYELKDLPGMLRTTAEGFAHAWERDSTLVRSTLKKKFDKSVEFMAPREAADHYLNHQFGWVPFISDLSNIIRVYLESRELIIQSVRENGQWVRRKRELDVTESDVLLQRIYGASVVPGSGNFRLDSLCDSRVIDGISCHGITDIRVHETTRTWAAGSFKFYRPEFDDNLIGFESELMNIQRLLTLYGVRVNPSLLWKITPWTWLVDWFIHLGDFIGHWDDMINDGIVAKYLYVMQEVNHSVTKSGSVFFYSNPVSFMWQRRLSTKRREPADSPYGFNRPWSSLTPSQWAILGAIGVSRTPNSRINTGL